MEPSSIFMPLSLPLLLFVWNFLPFSVCVWQHLQCCGNFNFGHNAIGIHIEYYIILYNNTFNHFKVCWSTFARRILAYEQKTAIFYTFWSEYMRKFFIEGKFLIWKDSMQNEIIEKLYVYWTFSNNRQAQWMKLAGYGRLNTLKKFHSTISTGHTKLLPKKG